jgi:Ni,Fe-hydrogenase I large subunit
VTRLVIDPVTRIEGHLRIEVQVDAGAVRQAWCSATMWRGLESILAGRDPREAWYFAQRICGVCTTVHALASVRAVEDALGITPPPNALILRDLIAAAQFVHDHVVHFYHLHALDWVDVTAALRADPVAAAGIAESRSAGPDSSAHLSEVEQRLSRFVEAGQLGPFANGYWGHPAYRLSPEANLLAVSHYLDALEFQREYAQIHAVLGGKNPHPQSYLVGGMATAIDPSSPAALNDDSLARVRTLLQRGRDFVERVYLPDLAAIANGYPEWAGIGVGLPDYLAFGDFNAGPQPRGGVITDGLFASGVVRGRSLDRVEVVDPARITESAAHSWLRSGGDPAKGLSPWDEKVRPHYTGPTPPYEHLDVDAEYSWARSPRYGGTPVEVGPLARLLVGYAARRPAIVSLVDRTLQQLGLGHQALFSTLGRTLARGLETMLLADHAITLLDRVQANIVGGDLRIHDDTKWDPGTWPATARGVGFHEAPRGGLSHWVVIENGKLANYQAVVPSTWNAGPRDGDDRPGAYEAALVGTPLADPARPLEVLRTVHSFDPCMACAAHVLDADGSPLTEVRIQ